MTTHPHWTDPGAFPVSHGVHRIPLPLPMDALRAVNVYAIETENGLVLVDGGWAIEESRKQLDWALVSLGFGVADISRFLVTHAHRDHYTQAVVIGREFGSHVSLGVGDKESLDQIRAKGEDQTVKQLERAGARELGVQWSQMMSGSHLNLDQWGYPDSWLSTDLTLELGDRNLEAVATPGHTQGHYVFADLAAELLFAGDHVLPTITPSIGFEAVYAKQPLGDFLNSLAKVRAMPDLMLLPAHGSVTASSHARIDELADHHEHRLYLCQQIIESGVDTAYGVAQELPWTRHHRNMRELDVFNAGLATTETFAHLELLGAQGRVGRIEVDGTIRFRKNSVRT